MVNSNSGGGDGTRTRVRRFAGAYLTSSATPPEVTTAAGGTRTPGRITRDCRIHATAAVIVRSGRLELPTYGSGGRRSVLLGYERMVAGEGFEPSQDAMPTVLQTAPVGLLGNLPSQMCLQFSQVWTRRMVVLLTPNASPSCREETPAAGRISKTSSGFSTAVPLCSPPRVRLG